LSDVAALAAATARALATRWLRDRPITLAFRLRLRMAPPAPQPGWTNASAFPEERRSV
jgi:hypothetical protein